MQKGVMLLFLVLLLLLAACNRSTQGAGNVDNGAALFAGAAGCGNCHSLVEGETLVGPSLAGVAGRGAQAIKSPGYAGMATTVEEYLRESILEPDASIATGFSHGIMPDFFTDLNQQELGDLVAFLATLR